MPLLFLKLHLRVRQKLGRKSSRPLPDRIIDIVLIVFLDDDDLRLIVLHRPGVDHHLLHDLDDHDLDDHLEDDLHRTILELPPVVAVEAAGSQ